MCYTYPETELHLQSCQLAFHESVLETSVRDIHVNFFLLL